MQSLARCLVVNLAALVGAGALLLWYPRTSGFTITLPGGTHYIQGGVFLGTLLVVLTDLAIAGYLCVRLAHGH